MPLVCFAGFNSLYHNRLSVSIESIETSKCLLMQFLRCVELREDCVHLRYTAASTFLDHHRPPTFTHSIQVVGRNGDASTQCVSAIVVPHGQRRLHFTATFIAYCDLRLPKNLYQANAWAYCD